MSTSGSVAGDRQRFPRDERRSKHKAVEEADDIDIPALGVTFSSAGMKLPTPSRFSGKKGTLLDFLNQTDLYMAFYHEQFSQPEMRNLFMISYLEGDAAAALQPQFDEYLQAKDPGAMQDDQTPFMNNRHYVRKLLLMYFRDTTEVRQLKRKLMTISQKGPATEYTAKFRGISARLDWSEKPQMAQYRKGLKDEIKDELATQDDPKDLGTLITRVHAIDNRLYERRIERKVFDPSGKPKRRENISAASAKPPRGPKGKKNQKDLSQVECYNCHKKGVKPPRYNKVQ